VSALVTKLGDDAMRGDDVNTEICRRLTKYYAGPPNFERTKVSVPRPTGGVTPPPDPEPDEPHPWRWPALLVGLAVVLVLGSWLFRQIRDGEFFQIPEVVEVEVTSAPPPTHTPLPTYTPLATFTSAPAEIVERIVTPTHTPTPEISPTPSDTPSPTNTPEPTATKPPTATPFPLDFTITEDFDDGEIDPSIEITGVPILIDGYLTTTDDRVVDLVIGDDTWRNYTVTFDRTENCIEVGNTYVRYQSTANYAQAHTTCGRTTWWNIRTNGDEIRLPGSSGLHPSGVSGGRMNIWLEDNKLFQEFQDRVFTYTLLGLESGGVKISFDGGRIDNLTITRND
jgi:hypothetical protein